VITENNINNINTNIIDYVEKGVEALFQSIRAFYRLGPYPLIITNIVSTTRV